MFERRIRIPTTKCHIVPLTAESYVAWFSRTDSTLAAGSTSSGEVIRLDLVVTPKNAYHRENVTIDIPSQLRNTEDFFFWLAVTSVNEYKAESPISNSAPIRYSTLRDVTCPAGTLINCFPDIYFYLILGGIVFLGIIIGLSIAVHYSRSKRTTPKPE